MSLTKQFIQEQMKVKNNKLPKPDVDADNPSVELYCAEHQSDVKSYVFHGEKLFFEGYPYSIELTQSSLMKNHREAGFDFEKCKFFEAYEGTLLRVFNIQDKWYVSTNRRLNAMNSKWAAKTTTFGLCFADAVRDLVDAEYFESESLEDKKKTALMFLTDMCEKNLDKSKKYMFLLKPCEEERIVCETSKSEFLNVGVFDEFNQLNFEEDVFFDGCKVPKPLQFHFKSFEEMMEALEDVDIRYSLGFIAIQDDHHYKIMKDKYKELFALRNNVPSIRFRYLQLEYLKNVKGQKYDIQRFLDLYNFDPEPVRKLIWDVAQDLFSKYRDYYIMRNTAEMSENVSNILSEVHNVYRNRRYKNFRIDPNVISDILAMQRPSTLNHLIREYEKENKVAKE